MKVVCASSKKLQGDVCSVALLPCVDSSTAGLFVSFVDGSARCYDVERFDELIPSSEVEKFFSGAVVLVSVTTSSGKAIAGGMREGKGIVCASLCEVASEDNVHHFLDTTAVLDSKNDIVTLLVACGRRLISLGTKRILSVFEMDTFTCVRQVSIEQNNLLCMSCTGPHLWCGSEDGEVHIFSLQNTNTDDDIDSEIRALEPAATLTRHTAAVNTVSCVPASEVVITGSEDGRLLLWNAWSYEMLDVSEEHQNPITCIETTLSGFAWSFDISGKWSLFGFDTSLSLLHQGQLTNKHAPNESPYATCAASTSNTAVDVCCAGTNGVLQLFKEAKEKQELVQTQRSVKIQTSTPNCVSTATLCVNDTCVESVLSSTATQQASFQLMLKAKDDMITELGRQLNELEEVAGARELDFTAAEASLAQERESLETAKRTIAECTEREKKLLQKLSQVQQELSVALTDKEELTYELKEAKRSHREEKLAEKMDETLNEVISTMEEREAENTKLVAELREKVEELETGNLSLREQAQMSKQQLDSLRAQLASSVVESQAASDYNDLLFQMIDGLQEDVFWNDIGFPSPRKGARPEAASPQRYHQAPAPERTDSVVQLENETLKAQVELLERVVDRYKTLTKTDLSAEQGSPQLEEGHSNALTGCYMVMSEVLGSECANQIALEALTDEIDNETVAVSKVTHSLCTLLLQATNNTVRLDHSTPVAKNIPSSAPSQTTAAPRGIVSPSFESSPPRPNDPLQFNPSPTVEQRYETPPRSTHTSFTATGSLRMR